MKKIIAIALALVMCLGVMSMVAFAAAPTLDSLAIVGENIPGVPAWKPEAPEGDMTKVSDGVYEKVLECPAGTNMNFKVAGNDKWDDTCNFGSATLALGQKADLECSGGSGNMNLTFDKAIKIKITVDVNPMNDGGAATILVEEVKAGGSTPTTTEPTTAKPTTTQPTTAQPTTAKPVTNGNRTLTIKAPAGWTKVCVYSWTPEPKVEAHGGYPGGAAQKQGDVYKVSAMNAVDFVITGYKADTTTVKTGDIKLEANGKNATITINEDGTFTIAYEGAASSTPNRKPAAADPVGKTSNYRVVGNAAWMGSWKEDNALGVMIEVEPGVYRKNFDNVEPGSYELKITKDGKWDNAYGTEDGQNFKFTVDQKCKITVDFTLKDGKGVISVYGSGVPSFGDVSMISVVILMALASVTAIVLVVNKKKFI